MSAAFGEKVPEAPLSPEIVAALPPMMRGQPERNPVANDGWERPVVVADVVVQGNRRMNFRGWSCPENALVEYADNNCHAVNKKELA